MDSLNTKEEDKKEIEVVFSYKKGKHPIAKTLLINNQDYKKVLD